jgi:hypothetical protein
MLCAFMGKRVPLIPIYPKIHVNGRRKITQNTIKVDAETKESKRKIEEKPDGRYKEGQDRKKPK